MNSILDSAFKAGKNLGKDLGHSHSIASALKFQAFGAALGLLAPGSPHEKMHLIGVQLGTWYLASGIKSPVLQNATAGLLALSPVIRRGMVGTLHAYRASQDQRIMAAVPFTHSTLPMDQAFTALQYARSRVGDAYSSTGNEAQMYAARYLAR